jgi:hypothetical protein
VGSSSNGDGGSSKNGSGSTTSRGVPGCSTGASAGQASVGLCTPAAPSEVRTAEAVWEHACDVLRIDSAMLCF